MELHDISRHRIYYIFNVFRWLASRMVYFCITGFYKSNHVVDNNG
jgi:hypothetical protein